MKYTNADLYPNVTSLTSTLANFKSANPSVKITKISIGSTGRKNEFAMVFDWED